MPGPLPKPAERRQRRNRRDTGLVALPSRPLEVPDAPLGLLATTRAGWERLWASPVASTFSLESDGPAIERLFLLRDERARAFRVARRRRLVEGSKGQPTLNPLLGHVASLDSEIRALEDRFGLTPRARLQLGVTFGEAHRSLDALNRAFLDEPGDE